MKKVSRTLVVGDLYNDGDLDVVVGNNGQTADLLRNDGGNRNNSLVIRAIGTKSNRGRNLSTKRSAFEYDVYTRGKLKSHLTKSHIVL